MDFGTRIRTLRDQLGMTQEELARQLNVSRPAVGTWEQGRAKPRLDKLQQLADLFGVRVSELMGEGEPLEVTASATVPVPLVATSHMGELADDETPDRVALFPADVVDRHPGCFAVRAEGGCMDKRYPSGCVLLVDPPHGPAHQRRGHGPVPRRPLHHPRVHAGFFGPDALARLMVRDL